MFQPTDQDAASSTVANANLLSLPVPAPTLESETLRHLLFSRPIIVHATIKHLYALNYTEPNEWSKLIPTAHPNEVMAILTKGVRVDKTMT